STIARAFAGPMPGSRASSSALAELMLTRALASVGAAPAAPAPRPDPTSTSPQRSPAATALTIRSIAHLLWAPPRRRYDSTRNARRVPPLDARARGVFRACSARDERLVQRGVAPARRQLPFAKRLC